MDFYQIFRPVAFKFDPEEIHNLTFKLISRFPVLANKFGQNSIEKNYQLDIAGMNWSFPIGLAAGLDKNASAIDFFQRLYFGATEIGTVTPKAQVGNPRPRLFRISEKESLRNAMGFNNAGADVVLSNIEKSQHLKPIGVNLGKNKTTPEEKAIDDYLFLYKKFSSIADYLVVNISSPNTPGLRDLQSEGFLKELFSEIKKIKTNKPLFVKIAPDIDLQTMTGLVDVCREFAQGIIATNTTIMPEYGAGGISGKLLSSRSKKIRKYLLEHVGGDDAFEVIGVGGIADFQDLIEFWKLGGKVVQIYTSFIYQGPNFLGKVKKGIDDLMQKEQIQDLTTLIQNINNIM